MLYRLTNRHGNRTRRQITRKIVHRDSRSCISIKMRMNRSRNIFCISEERVRNISSYRPIIAIGWIFQRYKDCIFFLRTSINCIGEVSIAILCIEKVDSVVGILFIIPPFRFRGGGAGRVDSRRRRDKMEEVREKKCRKKGEERR